MAGGTHRQAEVLRQRPAGGRITAPPSGPGRRRPAFTLTELMVAVGILLILLTMVGTIFSMATKASSTANANSEIMSNLRTVEQQLTHDFATLRRDAFIGLWYQLTPDPTDASASPRALRTDRIVFFSNEAHYSVQALRDANGRIVNALAPTANQANPLGPWSARIFYGHAASIDPTAIPTQRDPARWALGRRAKLLAPDIDLQQLQVLPAKAEEYDLVDFETEAPTPALAQPLGIVDWQNRALFPIETYFEAAQNGLMVDSPDIMRSWIRRPVIDASNNRGPHMLLLPGCAELKIQRWAEFDPRTGSTIDVNTGVPWIPRWWPESDLNGNGIANENAADSDFVAMSSYVQATATPPAPAADTLNIREYLNGPFPETAIGPGTYGPASGPWTRYYVSNSPKVVWFRPESAYTPKAIKVTINLHDTNRRLNEGRQLTMVFPLQ